MKPIYQLLALICLAPFALQAQLFNQYAVFDGSGDYFLCNNVLPAGNFTVEFYFRECDDADLDVFRSLLNNSDDFNFSIKKQFEDGEFHFDDRVCEGDMGGGCAAGDVAVLTSPDGDEWHHAALVFNKTTKCLSSYFDGVHAGGVCASEYKLSSKNLFIGKSFSLWYSSQGFRGQIDEIRISDNLRYTGTYVPPTLPFVDDAHTIAIWHMDTTIAGIVEDATGGGHDLVPYGDAHLFSPSLYSPTITGLVTVNVDEVYTYTSPDFPEYLSATWNSVGSTITAGGLDTAYISWPDTGDYTLTLTITDQTLCETFSTDIVVHVIEQIDCIPTTEICNGLDDNCNGIIDDDVTETIYISADGPTTFCQGGNVILSATYSGVSVQWQKGGVDIMGATFANFTATQKGTYTCVTFSECGSTLSNEIIVVVNKSPVAEISADGPTTFCPGESVTLAELPSGGVTYQWYKGAAAIPGATNINYTVTLSGNYKCKVTKTATGCYRFSNAIAVSANCKQGEIANSFVLFPNPVNDILVLEWTGNFIGELSIFNTSAQLIYSTTLSNSITTIDVSDYASGLYLVKVVNSEGEFLNQFIKN